MYTHETKSSNHKAVANQIVQRRGGQTAPQAFVDRRSSNESQSALQRAMVCQPTIQMNKNLNDTIYYGYALARHPYLAHDRSADKSMPHLTVDSLNKAIGLSNLTLKQYPMGIKRKRIQDAIADDNSRDLSQDEKDWASWLCVRSNVLLMHDMTGEQCRYDMNMKNLSDSFYNRWAPSFLTFGSSFENNVDSKELILNYKDDNDTNKKTWTEEDHSANVANRTPYKHIWTPTQIEAHDKYVDSSLNDDWADCKNALNRAFNFTDNLLQEDSPVLELTNKWLSQDVMHRFWRLTSLMGLDFFVHKGKHIVFVREKNQQPHFDAEGRKSITDSEWDHARDLGYVKDEHNPNGYVERVNPV